MKRLSCIFSILLLMLLAGCGSGNNAPKNVGLFGNWNVAMYPTGSQTAVYVFGLALSQEGTNYSGASITYNGSVPVPSNMCISASHLRATATTSTAGNTTNYTMTITDTTSNTVITVTGTENPQSTTVTGNYSNPASATCPASVGTMDMVPQ